MARKKVDQARDGAGSGDDTSAVLTDERSDATSATTGETDDAVSLDEDVRDDDTDAVDADDTDTDVADDSDVTEDTEDTDVADDSDVDEDTDVDEDVDEGTAVDEDDDEDDDARHYVGRGTFFATLGVAVVAVLGVLFLLGAFVWPAFLGPGSPEDTGNRAVSALAAKDPARLGEISCVRLDGSPAASFPPELLALIGNAAPAGPARQTLDTEARVPIDLTLTQGGQSQTLPADLLMGVNDGDWCLNGISQRQ